MLSTLHTNSAPETVTRLLDMGLEPFNVASALNLVLAQRLVRRICGNCKSTTRRIPTKCAPQERRGRDRRSKLFTEEAVENAKKTSTKHAKPFSDEYSLDTRLWDADVLQGHRLRRVQRLWSEGPPGYLRSDGNDPAPAEADSAELGVQEIKEAAVQDGMLTLRMDGWFKILKGITTVEQVVRETSS